MATEKTTNPTKTARSVRSSAKIAVFVLIAAFSAVAFNIYSEVKELALIEHLEAFDAAYPEAYEYDADTLAMLDENEARQQDAMIAYLAALLFSMVMLLVWVRRTNVACRELGANDMRFSPTASWVYWLIPFLNLVRPFQIVRELWTVTDEKGKSTALIGWWWAAWLLSGLVSRVAGKTTIAVDATHEQYREAAHMYLVSHGLDIVGYGLTIVLVLSLTRRFEAFQERVSPAAARVVKVTKGALE